MEPTKEEIRHIVFKAIVGRAFNVVDKAHDTADEITAALLAAAQSRAPGEGPSAEQERDHLAEQCTELLRENERLRAFSRAPGEGEIAQHRDAVIEECAKVADATAEDYYDKAVKYFRKSHEELFRAASDAVDEAAAAIRALKSPPSPAHNAGEAAALKTAERAP